MTAAAAVSFMVMASARAFSVMSMTSTATAAMSAASTARVNILSVQTLSEFLFSSLANRDHFSCEMKCLASHLVVEIHLHGFFCNLENHTRDNASHAVHHRDSVSWNEKIFAYLSVDCERRFREIYDPVRICLAVTVSR